MKLVGTTFKSDVFNKRFRGNKKLHLPKIRNILDRHFGCRSQDPTHRGAKLKRFRYYSPLSLEF